MLKLLFTLVIALYIVSCDDAKDLTLPEGQLPDAPIAVMWRDGRSSFVNLAWTKVPRATGYHVYYCSDSDGEFDRIASVRDTVTEFAFVSEGSRYFYVTAVVDSVESPPSGQVGSIGIVITGGATVASTPISFPLTAWRRDLNGIPIPRTTSDLPQDIIFDQIDAGDEQTADLLIDQNDTSRTGYRNLAGEWVGVLPETRLHSERCYLITNRPGTGTYILVSCGRVLNGNVVPVWISEPECEACESFVMYAWRESRRINVSQLGLLEAGFLPGTFTGSDRIARQDGGSFSYYIDGAWRGSLINLEPGRAFFIQRKHPGGYFYTYTAPE